MISADPSRQCGPIEQIREDHVNRYLFAAEYLQKEIPTGSRVLDIACGCGYGSWLLHGAGFVVTSVDISDEAISYAQKHYQGPTYLQKDCYEVEGNWDAVVSFETLEHLARPEVVLRNAKAPLLIASVPNENQYPFSPEAFKDDAYPHLRHYTPEQFREFLLDAGWSVKEKFCQKKKIPGDVEPGSNGIFLIYVCEA